MCAVAGSAGAARSARPAARASRAVRTDPAPAAAPAAPAPLSLRYSFALYQIWCRAGATTGVGSPQNADGSSRLTHLPLEGVGPWMDSSRSQWHRHAFEEMMRAGVNSALIDYRAAVSSRRDWGRRGVDMAVQALREMRAAAEPTPTLALYLDLAGGPRWDLTSDAGRDGLYDVVREFYRRVPSAFRATVALPGAGDRAEACPLLLGESSAVQGASSAFVTDLRDRFRRDFGQPLAIAGEVSWRSDAPNMDAYFALDSTKPYGSDAAGPIHTVTLTPSYNERGLLGSDVPIRARVNGRAYVAAWNEAARQNPDWIVLNSWNGWREGTELAASREAGDRDLNLTRAALASLDSNAPLRARMLHSWVPSAVRPGSLTRVEFRVQNAGLQPWPQSASLLRYEWVREGESAVASGDASLVNTTLARQEQTLGLLVPAKANLDPLPEGDYRLRFSLLVPASGKFAGGSLSLGTYPVHVGPVTAQRGTLIECGLPSPLRAGPAYRARVRIRNDGGTTWTRADGYVTYRWRRVADAMDGSGADEVVARVGARTPLRADVPPGALVDLDVDASALDDSGHPLDVWTPDADWHYELEWVVGGPDGEAAVGERIALDVVSDDPGVDFPLGGGAPQKMDADVASDVKVVVRNGGPEKWRPGQVAVACRWLYWDGVPMGLPSPKIPVRGPLGELGPGEQALVRIPVQTPPFPGTFLLVVDPYVDGKPSVEGALVRGMGVLSLPVTVQGGGFRSLALTDMFTLDGVSPDSLPGDGNFDGEGHTFPGQLLPPLVLPDQVAGSLYPSGYMAPVIGFGLDADRHVPFEYPDKRDGAPNMVVCTGQTIRVRVQRPSAIHLLMASDQETDTDFTLQYDTGAPQTSHLSLGAWDRPPAFQNESVAYYSPVRNGPNGVELHPAYLKHYVLECDPKRVLVEIDLPNDPHVRIMAITVERW